MRREDLRVEVNFVNADPVVAGESRPQPRVVTPARVDGLAVVQVVRDHSARAGRPAPIRGDDLSGAVFEGDFQLSEHAEFFAVQAGPSRPAQSPTEPAVAQGHAEHVVGIDEAGDVIGRVAETPFVAAPAGRQKVIRDRAAVEPSRDDAEGGERERGAGYGPVTRLEREFAPQQWRAIEVFVGSNHSSVPAH
jgi:hypothetical protein